MAKWSNIELVTDDAELAATFSNLAHVLFGLYIWEWLNTLRCEWQYITGAKKFRWQLTFYFLNRYCLFAAAVGLTVALNVTGKVNCQALYTFNLYLGNISIGLASINLCLRTMKIWSQKVYVTFPLVAVILGHWSLLLQGVRLNGGWERGPGCVITAIHHRILTITFTYTTCFGLANFLLAGWGLATSPSLCVRPRLVKIMFDDGLIFFLISFVANLIVTVLMYTNTNPSVLIVANVPTAIVSTISACRAIRVATQCQHEVEGPETFTYAVAILLFPCVLLNDIVPIRDLVSA